MVLSTLILNATALAAGVAALAVVNRLRPVAGRMAAGVAGIALTAYGAVSTLDAAFAPPPSPPPALIVAGFGPAPLFMCL